MNYYKKKDSKNTEKFYQNPKKMPKVNLLPSKSWLKYIFLQKENQRAPEQVINIFFLNVTTRIGIVGGGGSE